MNRFVLKAVLSSKLNACALAVAGVLFIGSQATAQAPGPIQLFLAWPGIQGDATANNFQHQIVLLSYSQTASNGGTVTAPTTKCGQITVTKHLDQTSTSFLTYVLSGKTTAGPVTISFAQNINGNLTPIYQVELNGVQAVSITQSDHPSGVVETVVFMASQFQFTFGTNTVGFNCQTNQPI